MKSLALTTNQVQPGVLIATAGGPLFVPWRASMAAVATFLLGVVLRLGVDTAAAVGYLWRWLVANVQYQAMVFGVGLKVLFAPVRIYV